MTDFLSALPQRDVSYLNDPVRALVAAIIHTETSHAEAAIRLLRSICAYTRELRGVPLGHPAVCEALPPGEAGTERA